MAKVVIGCKLPNGIVLEHPLDPSNTVELKGLNRVAIIGADHATTQVDDDFWGAWEAVHKEFPALKSGAIFVAKSANDAAAIAKEFKGRKTGLEKMSKTDKKNGIKPADAKD